MSASEASSFSRGPGEVPQSDRSGADEAACQGYADTGVARHRAPADLDEVRHHQRCQDAGCAREDHQPYRDRQQQAYVPSMEPGDSDWSVVWGYSHLIGPLRRRIGRSLW
jgi:hypothetical protein